MTVVNPHMREGLDTNILEQVLDTEKFTAFYMKRPGGGRIMSTLIMFTPEGITVSGDLSPGHHGVISVFGYGLGWFSGRLSEDYLCEKFLDLGWHADLAAKDLKRYAKEVMVGGYDGRLGSDMEEAVDERRGAVGDLQSAYVDLKESKAKGNEEEIRDYRTAIAHLKLGLRPLRDQVMDLRQQMESKFLGLANVCDDGDIDIGAFRDEWLEINDDEDMEWMPGWGYNPAEAGWLCAIQQRFEELYEAPKVQQKETA